MSILEERKQKRDTLLKHWGQIFIDDLVNKAHILKNELIEMGIL